MTAMSGSNSTVENACGGLVSWPSENGPSANTRSDTAHGQAIRLPAATVSPAAIGAATARPVSSMPTAAAPKTVSKIQANGTIRNVSTSSGTLVIQCDDAMWSYAAQWLVSHLPSAYGMRGGKWCVSSAATARLCGASEFGRRASGPTSGMSCDPTRTNHAAATPTATIAPAVAHHGVGRSGSLRRGSARHIPNASAGISSAANGMLNSIPIG